MGRGIFGVDFGSTSFVLRKHESNNYCGKFFRLHKNNFQFIESEDICDIFLAAKQNEVQVFDFSLYGKSNDGENLFSRDNDKLKIVYCFDQNEFARIPGIPWAYWVSNEFIDNLVKGISVNNISDFTGSQHITANNDKYLRMLWEVDKNEIENNKWKLYAKGGGFKKWYGNLDTIVNWSPDAIRYYKENKTSNLLNERYWNQEGITYTEISSSSNTFRYLPPNCIFDKKGPSIVRIENLKYCLAALNSPVATAYFKVFNPSISTQVKDVKNFPIIIDERWKATIEEIVGENIVLSKADWDSYETSWEFKIHPLIKDYVQSRSLKLCEIYSDWVKFSEGTFDKIKSNEEELNRIFIEIYNLQNEMTPLVEDKLVTVSKPDLGRDIRSFISYVVGCILGRFSLDYEGLVYAGGKWDDTKYRKVIPVKDNILPITDEEYFEEDIVGLLINFLKKIYGDETLDENLDFIAKALGNKGNTSREIIRNYFVKDFFKDHCKVYQKRPIYWLFDSGKTDGFKALVYMHRYDENTIGNLRIDYLHKMQRVYDNEINRMQETIDNSSDGREVSAAQKRKEKLIKQLKETKEYDEKIAHLALSRISIDLDDGVIVNYEKIQTDSDDKNLDVLAKI